MTVLSSLTNVTQRSCLIHFPLQNCINEMLHMMGLMFFLVLFALVSYSSSKICPAKYQRFSKTHTFCLETNKKCDIKFSGVSKEDRDLILKIHNYYRNIVAMGNGARPNAADMLQMVWDNELAFIAQKWTSNCQYQHDCSSGCRTVDNFNVGQNIAIDYSRCSSEKCTRKEEKELYKPNWADRIADVYNKAMYNYPTTWHNSYQTGTKNNGHFAQIAWSKSWRIGCGFTVFKERDTYYRFYACNYGPKANVMSEPVYKIGEPCSACPNNTCCGNSCGKKMDYPWLCKMLNPNTAPVYPRNTNGLLFFCDNAPKNKDCIYVMSGTRTWKHVKTLSGNYDSAELKGGQSTKLMFKKEIKPSTGVFCVRVVYRKTPSKAGEEDKSDAELEIAGALNTPQYPILFQTSALQFFMYEISFVWNPEIKIGLRFSVPKGENPHIFDMKEIMAYEGICGSREV